MEIKTDRKKLDTNKKHLAQLERITIRVYKDGKSGVTKEQIEARAESQGESVNTYILRLITEDMRK
jgi:predicted HicB family RNase H-like nuclease